MDDFPKKKELVDAIIAVLQGKDASMKTADIDAAIAKNDPFR